MAAEWFAIRTRAGAEDRVAIGIEAARMEAYLPVELVRVGTRGNRCQPNAVMWRPVFPGHVLAMFDPGRDLSRLCSLQGVDGVLKRDGKLVPVAEGTIAALKSAERRGLFDLSRDCRLAVAEDEPPPDAALVRRIKSSRGSKSRTAVLMAILMCKT